MKIDRDAGNKQITVGKRTRRRQEATGKLSGRRHGNIRPAMPRVTAAGFDRASRA